MPCRPLGMATAGPDLYESLQIRYPPSPARSKPSLAGMLWAGAGSWLIPFLPQPSASSAGVPGVARPRLRASPASLPQRGRLGPLWPHPAGRWAPPWPWARGWSWCWGLLWQSSSPCVSATRAGGGRAVMPGRGQEQAGAGSRQGPAGSPGRALTHCPSLPRCSGPGRAVGSTGRAGGSQGPSAA